MGLERLALLTIVRFMQQRDCIEEGIILRLKRHSLPLYQQNQRQLSFQIMIASFDRGRTAFSQIEVVDMYMQIIKSKFVTCFNVIF